MNSSWLDAVSSRLGLGENEKVICISPVGYPKAKPSLTDRTFKTMKDWKLSRCLDCGIAMLHFELGARAAGLPGEWEFLEAPEVARYILSITSS